MSIQTEIMLSESVDGLKIMEINEKKTLFQKNHIASIHEQKLREAIASKSDYLMGMIGIVAPFVLYILNRRAIFYNYKDSKPIKAITTVIILIPVMIVFGIFLILNTGITDYKIMAIASDSMRDVYKRGDAIIYYQFKDKEIDVKEDQIIVFNKKGKIITHRVVNMKKVDGKMVYTTKGDNNEVNDNFEVYNEDIVGLVKYKIEYIGYPSIILSELMSR